MVFAIQWPGPSARKRAHGKKLQKIGFRKSIPTFSSSSSHMDAQALAWISRLPLLRITAELIFQVAAVLPKRFVYTHQLAVQVCALFLFLILDSGTMFYINLWSYLASESLGPPLGAASPLRYNHPAIRTNKGSGPSPMEKWSANRNLVLNCMFQDGCIIDICIYHGYKKWVQIISLNMIYLYTF